MKKNTLFLLWFFLSATALVYGMEPPEIILSQAKAKHIFLYRITRAFKIEYLELYPNAIRPRGVYIRGAVEIAFELEEFRLFSSNDFFFKGGGWEGSVNVSNYAASVRFLTRGHSTLVGGWRLGHAVSEPVGFAPVTRDFNRILVKGSATVEPVVDEPETLAQELALYAQLGLVACGFLIYQMTNLALFPHDRVQAEVNRGLVKQLREEIEAWMQEEGLGNYGMAVNPIDWSDSRGELFVYTPKWIVPHLREKFSNQIQFFFPTSHRGLGPSWRNKFGRRELDAMEDLIETRR